MSRKEEDLEYRFLQLIKEYGDKGILQSQLWKKIKVSSREGSRISLRLEKAGLIERRKELYQGKWTYKLIAKKKAVSIDRVLTVPCLFCPEQSRCGMGGDISPITCNLLSAFIDGGNFPENSAPTPLR